MKSKLRFCEFCDAFVEIIEDFFEGFTHEEHKKHKKQHHHHRKRLRKAKHLHATFISHSEELQMESYKLTWTPGLGAHQSVFQVVGGTETPLTTGLDISIAEFTTNFETDSAVEWFVRTIASDGTTSVDSVHAQFTASNQSPEATAATNLADLWVAHVS